MLKRIVPLVLALVLCAGLAQAKTKAPATQLPGDLTLAEAQKVLDAALVKAKAQGVPMNIAIVDAGGNLKAFVRQDGAFIGSIDVSTKKAVTARYFNMPTSTLGAASQPGQELFGIEATNGGLVIFGGGESAAAAWPRTPTWPRQAPRPSSSPVRQRPCGTRRRAFFSMRRVWGAAVRKSSLCMP